jgi:hypothetical protein
VVGEVGAVVGFEDERRAVLPEEAAEEVVGMDGAGAVDGEAG